MVVDPTVCRSHQGRVAAAPGILRAMEFRAPLRTAGKTATGVEVPDEVVTALGAGQRPLVKVTINGFTFSVTLGSMGGRVMLPVSAERRAAAGIAGGDELDIEMEVDTAPRRLEVPADLAEALESAPQAKRFFDGLTFSQQQIFTVSVEGAKTADTRQRRVQRSIGLLSEGRIR